MGDGHDDFQMTTARFTLPSAVHLFLLQENQILLLMRQNTGYEDGSYRVIAGHLEGDETVAAAVIRRLRRKLGYASSWKMWKLWG